MYPGLVAAAAARGLRTVTYSRGGYGRSSRRAGRSVADEAAISAALADRLGHERLFTVGWSGGGPVALACAALLPDRVKACVTLASLAPRQEAGAEWAAWIPADQRAEWDVLASEDQSALVEDFQVQAGIFSRMTPARLAALGGPPDGRALAMHHDEQITPSLIRSMRRAALQGHAGYLDDNVAQAHDWGFRVADIRVPVVVRHGELDRLADVGQGRWLARTIPGARGVFLPDAGHGSIALPWTEVVEDLLAV